MMIGLDKPMKQIGFLTTHPLIVLWTNIPTSPGPPLWFLEIASPHHPRIDNVTSANLQLVAVQTNQAGSVRFLRGPKAGVALAVALFRFRKQPLQVLRPVFAFELSRESTFGLKHVEVNECGDFPPWTGCGAIAVCSVLLEGRIISPSLWAVITNIYITARAANL